MGIIKMADLDEISLAIGELRAEIKSSTEARLRIERKLTCIDIKLDSVFPLVPRVMALELTNEDFKALRNRGLGAVAVIAVAASISGSTIAAWIAERL